MFNAGLKGYSGARGVMGALRSRSPKAALPVEMLDLPDAAACMSRIRSLPFTAGIQSGDTMPDVERDMRLAVIIFARRMEGFLGGAAKDFLATYLLHYDIHNLKVLFRGAVSGRADTPPRDLYPIDKRYTNPSDPGALANLDNVIGLMKGTRLEAVAAEAYDIYRKFDNDLSRFELALDRRYYLLLWQESGNIRLMEGQRLRKGVLAPLIGGMAVAWGLWLGQYRGMGPEEILSTVQVPGEIIRPEVYLRLARGENVVEAARAIGIEPLVEFFSEGGKSGDAIETHRLVRRFIWRTVSRRELGAGFDISTIVRSVMEWEYIVDDAISVMRAKSLGLRRDEIEPLLATRAA